LTNLLYGITIKHTKKDLIAPKAGDSVAKLCYFCDPYEQCWDYCPDWDPCSGYSCGAYRTRNV